MKVTTVLIIFFIFYNNCNSQAVVDSIFVKKNKELKGIVIDAKKRTTLPYTNIAVLHKKRATISNEKGQFSLDITDLDKNDTISFFYIGYKQKNITIGKLDSFLVVHLQENTFNISDVYIFGDNPNPKKIIKKVVENKNVNYKIQTNKAQIFFRQRDVSKFYNIDFKFKKSSFKSLNKKTLEFIKNNIPKHSTSYTDFLGYLYTSKNNDNIIINKTEPIKIVSLKDKNIMDFGQLEAYFEKVFAKTKTKEYWKVKSGIFNSKLEIKNKQKKEKQDSLIEISKKYKNPAYLSYKINKQLKHSKLTNKKDWEFLYKTGKYDYTLIGGANVNGEDVYIIDFTPTWRGVFKGRVYISTKTFALIRADYEYADGKTGKNIQIIGIGYSENIFQSSIFFEKKEGKYNLKYFSKETGFKQNIDRNLSLIKKRKRFLINKKLNEIKGGVNISSQTKESFEILFIDKKNISNKQFTDFKQKKRVKVIFVNQFDNKLWKGFSIIEPTKQMREYKKPKK